MLDKHIYGGRRSILIKFLYSRNKQIDVVGKYQDIRYFKSKAIRPVEIWLREFRDPVRTL